MQRWTLTNPYDPSAGFTRVDSTVSGGKGSRSYTHGPIVNGDFKLPNPWTFEKVDVDFPYIERYEWYPTKTSLYAYDKGYPSLDFPQTPTWDRNLVYNKALENLNEKVRGSLDLGVSFAEFRQVVGMFRGLRTLEGLGSRLSTRSAANAWLEWQYGWRPLMSDLYGSIEESLRVVINILARFSARASLPIRESRYFSTTNWGGPVSALRRGNGKQSCTIKIELTVPIGLELNRWTSLNPVSLAWELTPYSFVADWFYDVGSFLRAAETALLYEVRFVRGFSSELYYYDGVEYRPAANWNFGPDYFYVSSNELKVRKSSFERKVLGAYPFPRPPTVKVDLGWQRMLSLASLIRQKIR
jgi:hypothetical protein